MIYAKVSHWLICIDLTLWENKLNYYGRHNLPNVFISFNSAYLLTLVGGPVLIEWAMHIPLYGLKLIHCIKTPIIFVLVHVQLLRILLEKYVKIASFPGKARTPSQSYERFAVFTLVVWRLLSWIWLVFMIRERYRFHDMFNVVRCLAIR